MFGHHYQVDSKREIATKLIFLERAKLMHTSKSEIAKYIDLLTTIRLSSAQLLTGLPVEIGHHNQIPK